MQLLKKIFGPALVCALLFATFAPGCTKVETDLYYDVAPYISLPGVDTLIPYIDSMNDKGWVRVFCHHVDTTSWTVESYVDAADGIITNKQDGTKRNPDQQAWLNNKVLTVGPFTSGPVMLVAYDAEDHTEKYESKMYGWRQVDIQEGIPRVRIPVTFSPEKRGEWRDTLTDGTVVREVHVLSKWFIANDNPYSVHSATDDGEEEEEEGENGGGQGSGR